MGFELQNGAGEEMVNPQRDVPRSIIRSGVISVIGYTALIATVLFTLSKSQLTNVGGFLQAFKAVDTVLGPLATPVGWLVAIAFVFGLASSGGSWVIGADRTYAIASLDRTAPSIFGRFSGRYGTPIFVNTMTGIVASICYDSSRHNYSIWKWQYCHTLRAGARFRDLDNDPVVPVHLPFISDFTLQIPERASSI